MTRRAAGPSDRVETLRQLGVELIEIKADRGGGIALDEALAALASRGITRVLVEGGARLATALMRRRLIDRLAWVQAPMIIGGDGLAAIGALEIETVAEAIRLARAGSLDAGAGCAPGL